MLTPTSSTNMVCRPNQAQAIPRSSPPLSSYFQISWWLAQRLKSNATFWGWVPGTKIATVIATVTLLWPRRPFWGTENRTLSTSAGFSHILLQAWVAHPTPFQWFPRPWHLQPSQHLATSVSSPEVEVTVPLPLFDSIPPSPTAPLANPTALPVESLSPACHSPLRGLMW